ncbi:MAG: DUF616 domain-containing protein [Gammaproteobacteria bacterium]|nr:DUF616 domain-containing protein [Gammaproteobacteria bacterium]
MTTIAPKVAVVTCITAGVDDLHEPCPQSVKCDYYCFYDKEPRHAVDTAWKLCKAAHHPKIPELRRNGKLLAKWYKMQSHKIRVLRNYHYILWVDGSIKINNRRFVAHYVRATSSGICLFKHPWRDCIYKEFERVKASDECGRSRVMEQIKAYNSIRYPRSNGLYCGTVIGRYKNSYTDRVMDAWWAEVVKWSMRDQISLPYVLWRNKMKPDIFPHDIYSNKYIEKVPHTAIYYYYYRRNK